MIVNEEAWGTSQTEPPGFGKIFLYCSGFFARIQALIKARLIELQRDGFLFQMWYVELGRIVEERVVKLPKLTLITRT